MATNDFLPFATLGTANVVSQTQWTTDPALGSGFSLGVADSNRANKAWRQGTFVAAGVSQFIMTTLNQDVRDDGQLNTWVGQFVAALGVATGGQGFVPEAPAGGPYGRSPGQWLPVTTPATLATALLGYVRKSGDNMTGALSMGGNSVNTVVLDGGGSIAAPVTADARIYIRRGATVGVQPNPNSLQPGELAVQMGETTAPRLWVGVPTAVNATGMRLLADLGQSGSGAFLPLAGGTLTGDLWIGPVSPNYPTLVFRNLGVGNTVGGLWRVNVGSAGGHLNFQQNIAGGGDFSVVQPAFTIGPYVGGVSGNVTIWGALIVGNNPNATLTVGSNGYTNLYAPDNVLPNADAGIMIGTTANGSTFHRNAVHSFQNRTASVQYATMNSAGVIVNGLLTVGGNSNPTFKVDSAYSQMFAPDAIAGNAGIYIGSVGGGGAYTTYANTNHRWTDRSGSPTFASLNSTGLTVSTGSIYINGGNLSVVGQIYANGGNAALQMQDRTLAPAMFNWYAQGGSARLWSSTGGGDRITVDTSGNMVVASNITAGGSITSGGDFILGRSGGAGTIGYLIRPNVAGSKNLKFSTTGDAADLENVIIRSTITTCTGDLTVGNNPTRILTANSSWTYLVSPDGGTGTGGFIALGSISAGSVNYYRNDVHSFQRRDGSYTWVNFNNNVGTDLYPGTTIDTFTSYGVALQVHGQAWLTHTQCYQPGGDIPLRITADNGHYAMIHFAVSYSGYAWNAGQGPTDPGSFGFGEEGSGIAHCTISVPYQRVSASYDIVANRYGYKPGGGYWAEISERRLKRNIEPFRRGLAEILKLQPVRYQFNPGAGFGQQFIAGASPDHEGRVFEDDRTHTGFIAEDVADIMPEMLGSTRMPRHPGDEVGEEITTLDATPVFYAALNAIKELSARLEALEEKTKV